MSMRVGYQEVGGASVGMVCWMTGGGWGCLCVCTVSQIVGKPFFWGHSIELDPCLMV